MMAVTPHSKALAERAFSLCCSPRPSRRGSLSTHLEHLWSMYEQSDALRLMTMARCSRALSSPRAAARLLRRRRRAKDALLRHRGRSDLLSLHQALYSGPSKSAKGDALLHEIVLRGLLWAFSQSEAALSSDRGA